jgi:carotenoid cleavage dioxygenase-like enzyme
MTPANVIFVHRNEDSPEGEGYLMANVYDASTDKSQLAILDAQNITAGPIARAFLDHRVPLGFHGNWRPGTL